MKIEKEHFVISYTKNESEYIQNLVSYLEKESNRILDFFEMKELQYPVVITFWNDLNKFREFYKKSGKMIQPWLVGVSHSDESHIHYIDLLSLEEMQKCMGHEKDTLKDLYLCLLHEYVHTCHSEYKNYQDSSMYVNEGLATYLSNQFVERETYQVLYDEKELKNGNRSYYDFYMFMKYIIENNSKEYVLKLIKDKKMQEDDFHNLFEDFSNYFNTKQKSI